jgi:ArsR family transcriptional regulator, arsenate/arsenite/antimonite-responsive transcriptional repressor / arsenate reductase (thioredoxin)
VDPNAAATALDDPPEVFGLVSHRLRWRLLRELGRSDRTVGELTQLVGERQSLVSYHLAQLRAGGLVRARRSSADGRDSYYTVDLAHCGQQLGEASGALHPGLTVAAHRSAPHAPHPRGRRRRVLFLCTGNSARSQMAEALIEHLSDGHVAGESAGSQPKALHPHAVRVMSRRGIDISTNRTKHLDEFVSVSFDAVITLCDRVREVCPEFSSQPARVHWSMADPAIADDDGQPSLGAFERTADELEARIGFLLHELDQPTTRRS